MQHHQEREQLYDKYGFNFKKSLGQNFLIDVNIINNIIDASDIDAQTGVIGISAQVWGH